MFVHCAVCARCLVAGKAGSAKCEPIVRRRCKGRDVSPAKSANCADPFSLLLLYYLRGDGTFPKKPLNSREVTCPKRIS